MSPDRRKGKNSFLLYEKRDHQKRIFEMKLSIGAEPWGITLEVE